MSRSPLLLESRYLFCFFLALTVGCGMTKDEKSIRKAIEVTGEYVFFHKGDGDVYVRRICSSIEKVPDPESRIKLVCALEDHIFSLDWEHECPLENVDEERRKESMRIIGRSVAVLEEIANELSMLKARLGLPREKCWEVKFRFLETVRHVYDWRKKVTGFDGDRNYDYLVRHVGRRLDAARMKGLLTHEEYESLKVRLERMFE